VPIQRRCRDCDPAGGAGLVGRIGYRYRINSNNQIYLFMGAAYYAFRGQRYF